MAFSPNPGAVTATERHRIPMPDGVRLAARIWRPPGPGPFPALLEIIPYRKSDLTRARDERNHPFFAAHGFICARVDMRGSGDSEGHMPDMYSEDELADTRQVIDYLAALDECNGRVGMFGTSWGGTASLQAAVDAPAALRAVIANCATANRFEDDIHWQGGALLTDGFEWGATLPAILAAPPDAAAVGGDWMRMWQARLKQLAFPLDHWIRRRGAYWRHGSVQFDAARLACPILAVGGWADRYSNSVMQLVQLRPDICWGIVGPWGHHYPDHGAPGPAMGFQQLALAWWRHWLTDDADARIDWPRLRCWRREFEPPQDRLETRNGEWIEVDDAESTRVTVFYPSGDGLLTRPGGNFSAEAPNDLLHGACAGDTGYFGRAGGLPLEQSADDARALCFDSPPLAGDIDLIGCAEFVCDIVREHADAQLVVRLCEVAADGRSLLVARQVRNLALDDALDDDGAASAASFAAGKPARVSVRLPAAAYRFRRGNRIRLALGASYWPLVWPARPGFIRLSTKHAQLRLPRPAQVSKLSAPLPAAEDLPARKPWTTQTAGPLQREQRIDEARSHHAWRLPRVTHRYSDTGVSISLAATVRYDADLAHAAARYAIDHALDIERPDGRAKIQSALTAQASAGEMTVDARLTVTWNGARMAKRAWRHAYPRTSG